MTERMQLARNEGGFTLVELAIVLVIIGIILGSVLKGQDLVNNAKAKRVVSDSQAMSALAYTFFDRYGRFPGDCNRSGVINYAVTGAETPATFGAAIPPAGFCAGAGAVATDQWSDLIAAQLQPAAAGQTLALNTFNDAKFYAQITIAGRPYNAIFMMQIPCYAAKMLDVNLDGAEDAGLGVIRQLTGAAVPNATTAWVCATEDTPVNAAYLFDRRP